METRWIIACVGTLLWSGVLANGEIYCEVSSTNLAWTPQVRTAGQSKVVDMQSRDGPTVSTRCFVFDTGPDRAAFVLLQDSGDTERHSLSPSAPRLANSPRRGNARWKI